MLKNTRKASMWIMGKVGKGKAKPWCIQKKGLRVEKQKYNYRQGKTDQLSCLPPIFSTQGKKIDTILLI